MSPISHFQLDHIADPVQASYVALFGWFRGSAEPQDITITAFDHRLYYELHAREDIANSFPNEFASGLYSIVDIAALANEIAQANYRLPFRIQIDGRTYAETILKVSPAAITRAADGAQHKRRKRTFIGHHAACPTCGAPLADAAATSPLLTCRSCDSQFRQSADALSFLSAHQSIPKILNTSVFVYSPVERTIIDDVQSSGGWVLDFGAGLRESIEPRVVNLEIADYPTTDVLSDADRLPFTDGVFDAVISLHVLEHVRRPWAIAKEIQRVLKPGGVAVCTVPFISPVHGFPYHFFNMTGEGLRSLFEDAHVESHFVKPDGHPINALQQLLSTYYGNLDVDTRRAFGGTRIEEIVNTPLDKLVRKPYATALPEYARWKLAAHTTVVLRKTKGG